MHLSKKEKKNSVEMKLDICRISVVLKLGPDRVV